MAIFNPLSQLMQNKAAGFIPGKSQLLSKRPEMFAPGIWPGYFKKAKGQEIWDLDDNHYLDFSIAGIGANILGYSDEEVDEHVISRIRRGSSSSLNCPEEIELAELIKNLHPWVDMFRYTRSGGEAVAVAVRIARAHSGKDKIIFCGYHGWHDWYLSANLAQSNSLEEHLLPGLLPSGVPLNLKGTALPFTFNQIEQLKELVFSNPSEVAAVVMEPMNNHLPDEGFLCEIRKICDDNKIILIFDEISSAFRVNPGGIHRKLGGAEPDIAIFSKAISNGYPMAVIAGRENIMQSSQDSFISSTSWSECIGPSAAIATINKYVRLSVHEHLIKIGNIIQDGWKSSAENAGLKIKISGLPSLSKFNFEHPENLAMKTFYTQEMLGKGFLATGKFYAMYAHTFEAAEQYVAETSKIFNKISALISTGKLNEFLQGPVAHDGFKRLN